MSTINIGDVINDRYRISEFLGHGGMAEVYVANDIVSNDFVAVKILKSELSNDEEALKQFKNEINISAAMLHSNIVDVYNEGIHDNRPYIVIEYMKDQSLKNKLEYLTRFSLDEAISIMIQLLEALDYTHSRGLIHRDVKPDNIFYMANGTIKLGDFGIAKSSEEISSKIIGSVHYLAPEVIKGFPYSIRSDIYAAGITFFELITGQLPFNNGRTKNIADDQVNKPMPRASKIISSLPESIDKIILKATAKNPAERYLTANEYMNDLIAFQNGTTKKENLFTRILKNM